MLSTPQERSDVVHTWWNCHLAEGITHSYKEYGKNKDDNELMVLKNEPMGMCIRAADVEKYAVPPKVSL